MSSPGPISEGAALSGWMSALVIRRVRNNQRIREIYGEADARVREAAERELAFQIIATRPLWERLVILVLRPRLALPYLCRVRVVREVPESKIHRVLPPFLLGRGD